jgi:tetratricopeptide (TPR) repeat protein
MNLTPNQIEKLNQLGVKTKSAKTNKIFPILSISGLTLLSFSGLILFKNQNQTTPNNSNTNTTLPQTSVSPTQVPKSIQHYLLTSQQYFSKASQNQSVEDLNQAVLSATAAIKEFPNDYRGFYQRGRIYQSVLASQPQLFSQVIADLSQAQKLEPNNAEITRSLASTYAQNGDAQNTINYLSQTITLEPTKAQNFYDLALIQQQVGYLPQAIKTYNQLITLLSDPNQKAQVESEKSSLEKLIAQNPNQNPTQTNQNTTPFPTINLPSSLESPTIQASISDNGLIIATPEDLDQIQINNLTTSNSLSGNQTLPASTKEITINNSQVTSESQIYISAIKGGKNQNLQVLSKSTGSFIVGLDSSIPEDIEFNWWIIN